MATGTTTISTQRVEALKKKVSQLPDTRLDKVSRAKRLIADPQYPSRAVMREVARQLVKQWKQEGK